jgi:hypothetical protein
MSSFKRSSAMPTGTSYSAPEIPGVSQQQTDGILAKIYRLLNLPEWMHLTLLRVFVITILLIVSTVIIYVITNVKRDKIINETLKHRGEYFEKLTKAFPNAEIPEE